MSKLYRRLIENQPQVKVAARVDHTLVNIRRALLAALFAGFFYFFGSNLWHALAGG